MKKVGRKKRMKGWNGKPWTVKEEELAVALRTGPPALPIAEVAARLGRSVHSVVGKLREIGVVFRRYRKPGTVPALVKEYYRRGRTDAEIGRLIGVPFQHVQRARKKLGLPPGRDPKKHGRRISAALKARKYKGRVHLEHKTSAPECWGCGRRSGRRSSKWMRANGWKYAPYRTPEVHRVQHECYCPECWELARVYGMAGGNPPAGHSPPAGEPVKTPTGKSSPNRLACASGTG